jgi:hypothetical protein
VTVPRLDLWSASSTLLGVGFGVGRQADVPVDSVMTTHEAPVPGARVGLQQWYHQAGEMQRCLRLVPKSRVRGRARLKNLQGATHPFGASHRPDPCCDPRSDALYSLRVAAFIEVTVAGLALPAQV